MNNRLKNLTKWNISKINNLYLYLKNKFKRIGKYTNIYDLSKKNIQIYNKCFPINHKPYHFNDVEKKNLIKNTMNFVYKFIVF